MAMLLEALPVGDGGTPVGNQFPSQLVQGNPLLQEPLRHRRLHQQETPPHNWLEAHTFSLSYTPAAISKSPLVHSCST